MVGLTRRSLSRAVGAALIGIVVLVVPVGPAWAAASITVEPSTASPGDTITISGNVPTDGCPSSDAAQLTSTADLFPPDGFGPPATRAPTGDFSTDYAINASTPLGDYSIGVRCGGGNVGVSTVLHVVAAATTTMPTSTTTSTTTRSSTTTSTSTTTTTAASASSSSASASGTKSSKAWLWIVLVILLILAALVVGFYFRGRRADGGESPET